ncbi:imidazole glycerol phosphate synthase subunit HisH [Candidatus Bathyarchaeota archaeon]|nr:MAG: imidazole glycerol phosphate synthase subunit HisH [Candidatus Bathyarchaeota archaeon]
MGNIRSVYNALKHLGVDVTIISNPSNLPLEKIIIPGVGGFEDGMRNLKPFIPSIEKLLDLNIPILGICLGLQMFFEESEESLNVKGLGFMKGKVVKIRTNLKLPQIGWNKLTIRKRECPLFKDIENGYVYFVHSYHAEPEEDVVVATTNYGCEVTAVVWKNNLYGVQFHPEKSGRLGLKILKNFLEL